MKMAEKDKNTNINEEKKTENKENQAAAPAKDKKIEAKAEDKKTTTDSDDDDFDAGDLILENERESIPLTPQNAIFTRSEGGLISLTLKHTDTGEEDEFFERVIVIRSFPITNPDEFLSVRLPESKKFGRSKEIGMIRYMNDFDEATVKLLLEELDRRYFTPQLTKILSVKDKFGYLYWDAETSAGSVTFILNDPFSNIRVIENDPRVYMYTIDGNCFEIPDPKKLDPASYHKIEIYL